MTTRQPTPAPRHPPAAHTRLLWLHWLLLTSLLATLVLWASQPQVLQRSNAWLQDVVLRLHSQPAAAEVVLVLADDHSIARIGRWPWRRALHAQVVQHIEQGQPQSIGLDFLFTEPDLDYPADDALLAQTLAASRRVVLPIAQAPSSLPDQPTLHHPLDALADNAARLGHSHIALDSDGSVRHFLPWESDGTRWWPHLGLAMLCVEHPQHTRCQPPHASAAPPAPRQPPAWHASAPLIRFAQADPSFTRYAYIDVLQGRIPPSAFRNKHVLIGASATGVSINQNTPAAPDQPSMSNAELLGHILHSQLQERPLQHAPAWANQALNTGLVLLGMLALWLLGPSAALLTCLALGALALLLTLAAPAWGWALQPVAGLLGLASAYPLWGWRRQSAALRFLHSEMRTLQAQGVPLEPHLERQRRGDFVQQRINAVEQALARLHQLQTQREQAMRFISHDIRAPVSAILTAIDLEQHLGPQKDGPPLLERITHNAHHALRLADDFVHLARSLEQPSTQRHSVELGLLIDQVLDDAWAAAQARHVQLHWQPPVAEALVWGDANQLRRALNNLLGNAIKYGPADSQVSITLQRQPSSPSAPDTPSTGWQIAIADQGEGIAPDELPHLFAPFARQKRHEAGDTSGIGLGLAYVRTVVEQHGGRVWADNQPTGGAVFTVALPEQAGPAPKPAHHP